MLLKVSCRWMSSLLVGIMVSLGLFQTPTPQAVEHLVPKVLSTRPHDTHSYTEGLVWQDGTLYESAGLYGESNLRQVNPQTGEVLRQAKLEDKYFGEGIALVQDRIIQLTWKEGVAFEYDARTFEQLGTFSYEGEGWGMCFDGKQLYMSNGSHTISVRDPQTFAVTGTFDVTLDDQPVEQLNELECVDDSLYANVWLTNQIVRIDKATGQVTASIDASGLLTPQETAAAGSDGVLNGIAYDPASQTFLITGKHWPWMFQVQFVEPAG